MFTIDGRNEQLIPVAWRRSGIESRNTNRYETNELFSLPFPRRSNRFRSSLFEGIAQTSPALRPHHIFIIKQCEIKNQMSPNTEFHIQIVGLNLVNRTDSKIPTKNVCTFPCIILQFKESNLSSSA